MSSQSEYYDARLKIRKLEKELQAIKPNTTNPSTGQEPKETDPVEPKISIPTATSGGEQT